MTDSSTVLHPVRSTLFLVALIVGFGVVIAAEPPVWLLVLTWIGIALSLGLIGVFWAAVLKLRRGSTR